MYSPGGRLVHCAMQFGALAAFLVFSQPITFNASLFYTFYKQICTINMHTVVTLRAFIRNDILLFFLAYIFRSDSYIYLRVYILHFLERCAGIVSEEEKKNAKSTTTDCRARKRKKKKKNVDIQTSAKSRQKLSVVAHVRSTPRSISFAFAQITFPVGETTFRAASALRFSAVCKLVTLSLSLSLPATTPSLILFSRINICTERSGVKSGGSESQF